MDSAASAIESKERRLLLQASLQQAIIALQGRVIAGADPLLVLTDLLRTLTDLTASAAGFIAQRPAPGRGWHPAVTVNLGNFDLPDPDDLLGRIPAEEIPAEENATPETSRETVAERGLLQLIRPELTAFLVLKLPLNAGVLCLFDRPGGYDADIIDLLRSVGEVVGQLLAASHRAFVGSGTVAPGEGAASAPTASVAAGHLTAILGEIAGVVWSASLPDFTLGYISPSVEKMLGYPAAAFLERRDFFDEITPPEDQVLRLAAVHRAIEGGSFDHVHRVICADGSLRWVRVKANVVTDHHGKAVRLDGVLSDVTVERQTVERGRQSDALYRAVVEDQQEAIIRFRPDHTITFSNRQYAGFYNLAPEDLLGISLADLVTPTELVDIFERLNELSPAEPICLHEYEKPLPGGQTRWIRWVNRALFDSSGAIAEFQCVGHDISDLKRLESELADRSELLSLAVASSGDGIFEWNLDTNQVWLSPRWKEMFGYGDDELPNSLETWESLVDPTDRVRILTEIDAYLKRPEGVLRTRARYRHRHGGTVHVETRIISREAAVNGKMRLVGAMTDVSAKVVADQRMRDAIESLSDGFAWFDADDRMIMHNHRFLEFFPFLAGDDLMGTPFIDMVRHPGGEIGLMPDPEAYLRDRMQQHREGGSFELPLQNGGWVRVSERRTKEGGIVSIWSDITALKQAQERLLDAVATMQEGFLLVGPDEKIILTNQRCREMYATAGHLLQPGASYRDFLRYGAEQGEFIEAIDRPEDYVNEVMTLLYSDENIRIERELANGRWVLISQRKMSDGSVVGIRTDLTPQKRREAEAEAAHNQLAKQAATLVELAEKLEEARLGAVEANRAKTRFLAHMSHELRTPLNAVLGFTRLMSDELFGPIGVPKYKEYINLIHESGAHLLSLINDVLDLSKIEAGKMELDRRWNSVAELAAGSTRLMEGLAKDRQIKLIVQVMPQCERVYGDERSLKQMVINLLSNALKFTQPSGRVTLSFAQRDDGGSAITVIDTGIGMSPEDIVKALDPFGQVDGEIARQHHGTGLGLPLVKAMAEAHGGHLTIDSEPGIGTTMTLYLPGEAGAAEVAQGLGSAAAEPAAPEPAALAVPEIILAATMERDVPANDQSIRPGSEQGSEQGSEAGPGAEAFPSLAQSFAPPSSKPVTPAAGDVDPARPRLLLAEDNPVNRRLVLDILRELPVTVDCANDGFEALKMVAQHHYMLVLMDIQMPRMGGIEATEKIRGSGLINKDLPIVALTAHASAADQQRFIEAGMDGYLAKPFDIMALLKLVQKHLFADRARQDGLTQVAG